MVSAESQRGTEGAQHETVREQLRRLRRAADEDRRDAETLRKKAFLLRVSRPA